MAESSLSLEKSDLESDIGFFLGYGLGSGAGDTAWTTQQTAAIGRVLKGGVRQFYHPPPLEPGGQSYEWSFLKPWATLLLADGAQTLELPDDYGGFEGRIVVSVAGENGYTPVELVGPGQVRTLRAADSDATGRPLVACEEPVKGTGPTTGQRFQLRFYPAADQEYTLEFRYKVMPDALTDERPYIYGGAQHSETVLESCLAIAELRLDDHQGVHKRAFMERLAASVSMDRAHKQQAYGANLDRSDCRSWESEMRRRWPTATFDGVTP